jgi:hypothetical protein
MDVLAWQALVQMPTLFVPKQTGPLNGVILSSHFVQWFAYTTLRLPRVRPRCGQCRSTLPPELREKKGVPNYKLKEWIKRKVECIHVVRMTKDGSIGCSTPCLLCRKLISFDLRVVCTTLQEKCTRARWRTKEHLFQTDFRRREARNANRWVVNSVEKTIFYHMKSM